MEVGLQMYPYDPWLIITAQILLFFLFAYLLQGLKNNNDNTYKELSKSLETIKMRDRATREQE